MIQQRSDPGPDPRLLVIEITEADIKALEQWPLPDRILAQLLQRLERYQPRAIGVDLYRDFPMEPGHAEFVAHLQASPNIFVVTKVGTATEPTILPPPGVPAAQVGFNDVVVDPGGNRPPQFAVSDGRRRHSPDLLGAAVGPALSAAAGDSRSASAANPDHLQLGKAVFVPLQPDAGGYINADTRGYQILLNYRSQHRSVETITLTQALRGQLNPELIRNRIILIGTTAESGKDFFYTPYSSGLAETQRLAGVVVHAQMVSQFLDAATGERPLFWYWPAYAEFLWIGFWAGVGSLVVWRIRHPLTLSLGEWRSAPDLICGLFPLVCSGGMGAAGAACSSFCDGGGHGGYLYSSAGPTTAPDGDAIAGAKHVSRNC